jgi:hypothetical protein
VEKSDRDARGGERLAEDALVFAGHDLEERTLAGAVQAEHADLRAGEKREPDVVEDADIGWMDLPEALHRVNKLRHGFLWALSVLGDEFLVLGAGSWCFVLALGAGA